MKPLARYRERKDVTRGAAGLEPSFDCIEELGVALDSSGKDWRAGLGMPFGKHEAVRDEKCARTARKRT